jgi:hypothetical protein
MFRSNRSSGGRRQVRRSYIPVQEVANDPECALIQEQKDVLLKVLASYFAKEIDKDALRKQLRDVKDKITPICPDYVQTNLNACC